MVCLIVWYVSVSCTVLNVFCKIVCYVSVLRTVVFLQDFFALVFCTLFWMGSVRSFITLVPQEVFYICFVDGLLPSGVAHCFWCVLLTFCYASVLRTVWYAFSWQFVTLVSCAVLYVLLLTVCHVSALRTVLCVLCLIVWYVSASCIGLNVFCKIFCYVSVLRTLSNVFCWIVCDVSASATVLYVFCLILCQISAFHYVCMCSVWFLVTLVFCALFWMCSVGFFITLAPRTMFCMCSVDGFLRLGVAHCFLRVLLTFFHVSVSCTVWYEFSWQFVTLVSRALMCLVDSSSR